MLVTKNTQTHQRESGGAIANMVPETNTGPARVVSTMVAELCALTGRTVAQIKHAIEVAGDDYVEVLSYLRRRQQLTTADLDRLTRAFGRPDALKESVSDIGNYISEARAANSE